MIDHLSLPVADLARSQGFYDRVLGALGHRRVMDMEEEDHAASGYGGSEHEPAFWIGVGKGLPVPAPQPQEGQHIAFSAPNRAAVDRFHAEALASGGTDNGAPGLRPHYHPNYYAAFVIDPDGNHIEAVCHQPG